MKDIAEFSGDNRFLSNFFPCRIKYEGLEYPSVENAFQAAKTLDLEARKSFTNITAAESKKRGRRVALRKDWEGRKITIMKQLLVHKFGDPVMRERLHLTGDVQLIEGNWWNDRFWGVCNGGGQNWLGRLLMEVRRGNRT